MRELIVIAVAVLASMPAAVSAQQAPAVPFPFWGQPAMTVTPHPPSPQPSPANWWQSWGRSPSAVSPRPPVAGSASGFPFAWLRQPQRPQPRPAQSGNNWLAQWSRLLSPTAPVAAPPAMSPFAWFGQPARQPAVPWARGSTGFPFGFTSSPNPYGANPFSFSSGLSTFTTPMVQGMASFAAPMAMNYAIASMNPTTFGNFFNLMTGPSPFGSPFSGLGGVMSPFPTPGFPLPAYPRQGYGPPTGNPFASLFGNFFSGGR